MSETIGGRSKVGGHDARRRRRRVTLRREAIGALRAALERFIES